LADMTIPERRARFIEVLEEAERKQRPFNLANWVAWMKPTDDIPEPNICNTACCAVGLAMFDPALNGAGLKIGNAFQPDIVLAPSEAGTLIKERLARHGAVGPGFFEPEFNGLRGVVAAAAFFGIGRFAAERCFFSAHYDGQPTIAEVITRVKAAFDRTSA